jgi:hypothetical protein
MPKGYVCIFSLGDPVRSIKGKAEQIPKPTQSKHRKAAKDVGAEIGNEYMIDLTTLGARDVHSNPLPSA